MKVKHRRTLEAVFSHPTRGGVVFADIEALVLSLDGDVREGEGSRADFASAVEHYFADCAATNRKPQKPASGRLMLRVPPEVHASVVRAATACGKSLNQWATEVFQKEATN